MPAPVVAIVGRPNVGKSSLLNRLAGRMVSIVQDMPGVTRDRVEIPLQVAGRYVRLVDTGGYGFDDEQGLTDHIKGQIEIAMRRADLVVFIVDAHAGLVAGDRQIADLLRKLDRKVILVANKADGPRFDLNVNDFASLGFGTPLGVSATTNRNIDDLFELIGDNLDLRDAPKEPPLADLHIAIVGKRNAGKSTLVNAVARLFEEDGGDRVIVSEVPGTTRDSVDVMFEKDGHTMVVIDTAGVRKKRHMVSDDVEFYSYHRAQRSVRRADVVLLLIDATLPVSEPDKKLARYVLDEEKPVIIVCNKWDAARQALVEQSQKQGEAEVEIDDVALMEQFREYLDAEMPGLSFAPVAFITAKTGRNVPALLDMCRNLAKQADTRIGTGQLNNALEQAMSERTPGGAKRGKRPPKIYYATQVAVRPPNIVLFVNDPESFDESYRRFLLNRFRDLLPFEDIPIRLTLRARQRARAGDEAPEIQPGKPLKRPGRGPVPKTARPGRPGLLKKKSTREPSGRGRRKP